jgi:hypothetical protein
LKSQLREKKETKRTGQGCQEELTTGSLWSNLHLGCTYKLLGCEEQKKKRKMKKKKDWAVDFLPKSID